MSNPRELRYDEGRESRTVAQGDKLQARAKFWEEKLLKITPHSIHWPK